MRGSASSRIVGFVSVFLILPSLEGVIVTYTILLHPPAETLPPFSLHTFFLLGERGLFFLFLSPIAPPTISWPSRLDDATPNGRFRTAMPLTHKWPKRLQRALF